MKVNLEMMQNYDRGIHLQRSEANPREFDRNGLQRGRPSPRREWGSRTSDRYKLWSLEIHFVDLEKLVNQAVVLQEKRRELICFSQPAKLPIK